MPPRPQFRLHDHLGNTVVFFEDINRDSCITTEADTSGLELEILQRLWYYPFGMAMEGLSTWDTEPGQWYRYNGKERDTISGWTDFGARWGVLEIGRWNGVDPLAGKYYGWSPFCFTLNNPISFVDINGDSIGVTLLNSGSKKAFDAFFGTKEGKAFISKFAAKGQTINGHIFDKDGNYHKKGIDLVYNDRDFGKGKEETGGETTGGALGGKFIDGRLKLGVTINTTAEESALIDKVTTVTHESFLHVQEFSNDYGDNKKLDYSHDPFYVKTKNKSPRTRHHFMFHHKPNVTSTHPLATQGLGVLETVNSQKKLGYSRTQLWEKLWNFWD